MGVEILGEKVVLFRDSTGTIRCINDVCPHRGAPLHQGWVAEVAGHDCVVCPYHGWAFDAEGILRDVPAAETSEAWPHKPLVDSYPVEEKVNQLGFSTNYTANPVKQTPHVLSYSVAMQRLLWTDFGCVSVCRVASSGSFTDPSRCQRTSGPPFPLWMSWRTPPGSQCTERSSLNATTGASSRMPSTWRTSTTCTTTHSATRFGLLPFSTTAACCKIHLCTDCL